MFRSFRFLLAAITLMLASTSLVHAQIPKTLSYQGALTDTTGKPLSDGSYVVTFRLYDVATGGSVLWTEPVMVVLRKGLYTAKLGETTSFPSSVKWDKPYWMSLAVSSGPEMTPRVPLSIVPFSFSAIKADSARIANKIVAGNVQPSDLNQSGAKTGQVIRWDGSKWSPAGDSSGASPLGGSGTKNYLASFAASGTLGATNIYSDSTFTGIGRNTRNTIYEMFGLQPTWTDGWGGMYIKMTGNAGRPFYGYVNGGSTAWTEMDGTDSSKWKLYNNGYWLTVSQSGKVGVGTTNPVERLDVNGNIRVSGKISYAATKTEYLSGTVISTARPLYSNTAYAFSNEGFYNNGTGISYMLIPFHLPDNVTIQEVTVYGYDGDAALNLNVDFAETNLAAGTSPLFISGASSGSGGATSITLTPLDVVDNSTKAYSIQISLPASINVRANTWRVKYTYTDITTP